MQEAIFVHQYAQVVAVLTQQGWLTAAQASDLETLAGGL